MSKCERVNDTFGVCSSNGGIQVTKLIYAGQHPFDYLTNIKRLICIHSYATFSLWTKLHFIFLIHLMIYCLQWDQTCSWTYPRIPTLTFNLNLSLYLMERLAALNEGWIDRGRENIGTVWVRKTSVSFLLYCLQWRWWRQKWVIAFCWADLHSSEKKKKTPHLNVVDLKLASFTRVMSFVFKICPIFIKFLFSVMFEEVGEIRKAKNCQYMSIITFLLCIFLLIQDFEIDYFTLFF